MTVKRFELETRTKGTGPMFVDSYRPGDKVEQWSIEPGNNVTLKCDGVPVIADIVEAKGDNYKGRIVGFEGYFKECLNGKCLEDIIEFNFDHILACSR